MQVPNRTYNLSAESEAEQEEWITALTAATSMLESSKVHVLRTMYTDFMAVRCTCIYSMHTFHDLCIYIFSDVHVHCVHIHVHVHACVYIIICVCSYQWDQSPV